MANSQLFSTYKQALPADTINEAGGVAYKREPKLALAQYIHTGTLSDTFYVGANVQLKEILALLAELPTDYIAKAAISARQNGFMKDTPALLMAYLMLHRRDSLNGDAMRIAFHQVVDSGKMLRNVAQIIRSGQLGKKSFGSFSKNLMRSWFDNNSADYIFRQSVGNNPSITDVIKMVHPRGNSNPYKNALYAYLIGKEWVLDPDPNACAGKQMERQSRIREARELPSIVKDFEAFKAGEKKSRLLPNVPFEMLTALDLDPEEWKQIALSANWQTTRMNLNTFKRHGVFEDKSLVTLIANKLRMPEAIRKAKVFPYQLLIAYLSVESDMPREITNALQDAMEIAVENVPVIPGEVYVCIDVSGSMSQPVTGTRGTVNTKVSCLHAAALISAAILRSNQGAEVIPFSDRIKSVKLNPRDSVMTNANQLIGILGGGTACYLPLAQLNSQNARGDLVIYISDNQSWADWRVGYGDAFDPISRERKILPGTKTTLEWEKFKRRNKNAKLVNIDITPSSSTQAYEREDILNIGGFSDFVFNMINNFAVEGKNPAKFVDMIERIVI